jgi:TolB-like protein
VPEDTPVTEPRPQRQLSAILAADVAGYSRHIGMNEEGTLARLKELRRTVIDPKISEHRGRIVKTMGDGLLVQFASAVDAVRCAVDIQRQLAEQNAGSDEDRRIDFRMGINVGDILIDGEDIQGDGVNVAARLEGLSEPGSVCVSQSVYDHVRDKLELAFEDTGEKQLKNIARPVRVYRVRITRVAAKSAPRAHERASIAVLPFQNMSGDPEQEYFADGITEDIITELSRYRSLFVIARNSAFQYKAHNVDVRQVGRELGVEFVVEGSVRRAGGRLRITAQLIDANSNDHIWAERYDREMQDIFTVQEEVARTIAATLEGRVAASVVDKVKRKPTTDWQAYDFFLQGRGLDYKYDFAGAEALYARALELDPGYGHAYAFRAIALAVMHWGTEDHELLRRADECAQKALSIDANDAWSQHAASYVALCQSKFDLALVHSKRALNLNPNDVMIATGSANLLVRMGQPEEALRRLDDVMKRDPFPVMWFWEIRFRALFHLHRYEEALDALNNVSASIDWLQLYFAATYAHCGRLEDAGAALARFLAVQPAASVSLFARAEPYSDKQLLEHFLDGLRKAGLRK